MQRRHNGSNAIGYAGWREPAGSRVQRKHRLSAAGIAVVICIALAGLIATNLQRLSVHAVSSLVFQTAGLPQGVVGSSYNFTLDVQNNTGQYTTTVTAGTLPNGIVLSPDGQLTGTPGSAGSYTFTVHLGDTVTSLDQPFTLYVFTTRLGVASDLLGFEDASHQPDWWNTSPTNPATSFDSPSALTVDSVAHRIYVGDCAKHRVLVFNADSQNRPLDRTADYVLGQPDFSSSAPRTNQSGLSCSNYLGFGMAVDSVRGYLFVSDLFNNRVLVFDTGHLANGMNASYVLGQPDFASSDWALTQQGMSSPIGLAYDSQSQSLYVADTGAYRVLVFDTSHLANGMNATYVIGQDSFTDADSSGAAINRLSSPTGLTLDDTRHRLFVTDSTYNRVMVFSTTNLANGPDAINVLGQPDFTTVLPSRPSPPPSRTTLGIPTGLAYDPANDHLYVSDNNGDRVLVFDTASLTNNRPPEAVLGSDSFNMWLRGVSGPSYLSLPMLMYFDPTNRRLLVADDGHNRIIMYDFVTLVPKSLAGATVGSDYHESVAAIRAQGVVNYSLAAGDIPPGVAITADGSITGTPTTAGAYTFTVRVTDDWQPMGIMTDTQSYTVSVATAPAAARTTPTAEHSTAAVSVATAPVAAATPAPTPAVSPSPVAVLNSDPGYVSEAGSTQTLAQGDVVTFTLGSSSGDTATSGSLANNRPAKVHSVTVLVIGADSCDVVIQSQPIREHLVVGQTKQVDVDQDGRDDLRVTLASITQGRAQLAFKALAQTTTPSASPSPRPAIVAPTEKPRPVEHPLAADQLIVWLWAAAAASVAALVGIALLRKRRR